MDFKIEYDPYRLVRDKLIEVVSHVYNNEIVVRSSSPIFPYTAFVETVDDYGNKRMERIKVGPIEHFLNIASVNTFRNNIYLKKVAEKEEDNTEVYIIQEITLKGVKDFYSNGCTARDTLKRIESGEQQDCFQWYYLICKLMNADLNWKNSISLSLREGFDFSGKNPILNINFGKLINEFKIHKIVKSNLHFNKPKIEIIKW